jgi:autotransporter-associated beta strand protein
MKNKYSLIRFASSGRLMVSGILATAPALVFSLNHANAADGSWAVNANGNWTLASNWVGGSVAGGAGSTATFDLDITADRTITTDANITVGNLVFRDTALASSAYIIGGTANTVTLDDGANKPTISVYPRTADGIVVRIDRPVAGSNGFELLAPGGKASLGLGNVANTISGSIVIGNSVDSVMLRTDNNGSLGSADALTTAVDSSDAEVTGMVHFTEIKSGGTLNLNGNRNLGTEFIKVQGAGWDGNGTIVNNTTTDAQTAFRQMQLLGDTTFGGSRRWDILGPSAGAGRLFQDGFTLTKAGASQIWFKDTRVIGGGDIHVNQGAIGLQGSTEMGGAGTVNINTGTTLGFWNLTGAVTRAISMNGGTLGDANTTANSTLASDITLTAANTASKAGTAQLILDGVISGTGSLTKIGTGILLLNNANTYTGETTVSAGTLALGPTAALASTNLFVLSGAVLDVSAAASPFTTTAGGTLRVGRAGGSATDINGALTIGAGSNVEIGTSARNSGTAVESAATIAGNTTFSGGGNVYFDLGATPTDAQDFFDITGDLTLNGVTNIHVTPTAGGLSSGNYTLMTYTGGLTGDVSKLSLSGLPAGARQTFALSTTVFPQEISLVATGSAGDLVWQGDSVNNVWDLNNTANFTNGGSPDVFKNLDTVLFSDTGSAAPAVAITGTLQAGLIRVNASAKNYTWAGTGKLSGSTGLLLEPANTSKLAISGSDHDFVGSVDINGGTVSVASINDSGAAGSLGAGGSIGLDGGTLEIPGTAQSNRVFEVGSVGGTLSIGSSGSYTHTGTVTGFGLIANVADGGILQVGNSGTVGDLGSAAIQTNTSGKVVWYRTNTTAVAVANPLSGSGIAEFKGNGVNLESQYALSGDNSSFAGTFVADQGRIGVDAATDLGAAAVEVKSGGGLYVSYAAAPLTNNVSISGDGWQENAGLLGAIRLQGANMNGTITLAGDARISAHGSTGTLSGVIAESGGARALELHNANTGTNSTITLSNTSSRTGANGVTGLVAVMRDSSALGSGDITVQSNGTAARITRLDLQGVTLPNDIILASNAQTNFRGALNASGGSATLSDPVVRSIVNGEVLITAGVGNGGHLAAEPNTTAVLQLNGPIKIPDGSSLAPNIRVGTVELGDTSGAGNLTILQQGEGTIRLVADNGMQPGIELRMAISNPGVFDLSGFDQSLGQLKRWAGPAATVTNSSADASTLTIQSTADHTFSGVIEDGGGGGTVSLIKSGPHALTLSGANTYTGATGVNAGTLHVNGFTALGSAVTVSGILGGTGTVGGTTTVLSGGRISPGVAAVTDVATLNFGTSVQVDSGASCALDITGATTHDKLVVAGPAVINGTITVTLTGYVPAAGDVFDVMDATTISGTPVFDFSAATLAAGLSWDTSAFATDGTIQVQGSDPYGAWASGFGLTGDDALKSADPDGDGVSNLMEFATNSNPKSGASGARAYHRMHTIGSETALTYTLAVRAGAVFAASGTTQQATRDSVRYTVEGSNDLINWDGVTVTELNPSDSAAVQAALSLPTLDSGWEWHSFRTDGGTATDASDFVRLRVNEVP